MKSNYTRELQASLDETLDQVMAALRAEGYWVISRIDPHPYLTDEGNSRERAIRTVVLRCLPRMTEFTPPAAGLGNLQGCTVILQEFPNDRKVMLRLENPFHLLEQSNPEIGRELQNARQKLGRILMRFDSLRAA
jgi:uncharacterized protein (DUF302 family)